MKNANGTGSITKYSGNRRKPYVVRITVDIKNGKAIRKVLGSFAKEREAKECLAEYNRNPYDVSMHDITFQDMYKLWGKGKYKGEPVPNQYAAAYKRCASIHSRIFVDIKTQEYQDVIDECELGYSTKKNIKTLCNLMTKFALANDMARKNYVELCKLPPQEDSELHAPFSVAELDALWALAPEHKNVQIVLILCYTGMRPTELCKVQSANVNLKERYLRGGIKTTAGKNRVIPIANKIYPFIESLMAENHTMLLEDEDGPLNYDKLRPRYWETAMTLLPKEMREHLPHDGRHTCATLMDNADINEKIKKLILGHSSSGNITEKVYTHKTIQQLIDAINLI